MPLLIEQIDAIARQKKRGVLFLEFHWVDSKDTSLVERDNYSYEQDRLRKRIINWLGEAKIDWYPCGAFEDENTISSYMGQIYIDLPFDKNNSKFCYFQYFLEHPDGSMRFDTVRVCYLPLKTAMKLAYQDKPGFWEKWAKSF